MATSDRVPRATFRVAPYRRPRYRQLPTPMNLLRRIVEPHQTSVGARGTSTAWSLTQIERGVLRESHLRPVTQGASWGSSSPSSTAKSFDRALPFQLLHGYEGTCRSPHRARPRCDAGRSHDHHSPAPVAEVRSQGTERRVPLNSGRRSRPRARLQIPATRCRKIVTIRGVAPLLGPLPRQLVEPLAPGA